MSSHQKKHGKHGHPNGSRGEKNKNKSRAPPIAWQELPVYDEAMTKVVEIVKKTVPNSGIFTDVERNYKKELDAFKLLEIPTHDKLFKASALLSRQLVALDMVLRRYDGQNDISHAVITAFKDHFINTEITKTIHLDKNDKENTTAHNEVLEKQTRTRVMYRLLGRAKKAAAANKHYDLVFAQAKDKEVGLWTVYDKELQEKKKTLQEKAAAAMASVVATAAN